MININGVGRLGQHPELKMVGANKDKPVCEVLVNMTTGRYNEQNEWVDRSFWCEVSLWGVCATTAAQLFQKGDRVFIVGKQYLQKWIYEDTEHSKMKIDASLMLPYTPDVESIHYKPRKGKQVSAVEESKGDEFSDMDVATEMV